VAGGEVAQVPDPIAVRRRLPADMGACVSVLRQVHELDRYPLVWPADPAAWLSGSRQVAAWVGCQGRAVCGHVALARPHPGEAATAWATQLGAGPDRLLCVCLLFVAPQARGSGAGARLLETALADARARGAGAALEVITLNRHAIALYQAQGWRRIGSVRYDWLPPGEASLLFVAPGPHQPWH
jgi:ribosomal protein S18 acetylase RimI-like enzyme